MFLILSMALSVTDTCVSPIDTIDVMVERKFLLGYSYITLAKMLTGPFMFTKFFSL